MPKLLQNATPRRFRFSVPQKRAPPRLPVVSSHKQQRPCTFDTSIRFSVSYYHQTTITTMPNIIILITLLGVLALQIAHLPDARRSGPPRGHGGGPADTIATEPVAPTTAAAPAPAVQVVRTKSGRVLFRVDPEDDGADRPSRPTPASACSRPWTRTCSRPTRPPVPQPSTTWTTRTTTTRSRPTTRRRRRVIDEPADRLLRSSWRAASSASPRIPRARPGRSTRASCSTGCASTALPVGRRRRRRRPPPSELHGPPCRRRHHHGRPRGWTHRLG